MIYFSPHIKALESQIAYLKERLEKAEREKREAEEAGRQRESALLERVAKSDESARVREDALLQRLAKAEEMALSRADALLDRVLVKNNVAPVAEPLISAPASPDMVTPYAGLGLEMQEAYKESWLKEETGWLMREDPTIDEGIARSLAEQSYVAKHQVIS